VCDPKALEMVGRDVTVAEVMAVVLRDRAYYASSRGGLTLSGGEPLFQPEFAERLLYDAKTEELHCAVETAGHAEWDVLARLAPLVDLWLFDYKETDPALHLKYTGVPRAGIVENLKRLHAAGAKIVLRCPMIPGHNARLSHLDGIVALARELPKLLGVELLPYYDLWRAKLARLGMESRLPASVKPPDRKTVDGWLDYLRQRGVKASA
jgi:pyruvate formate lyase activating enzyme